MNSIKNKNKMPSASHYSKSRMRNKHRRRNGGGQGGFHPPWFLLGGVFPSLVKNLLPGGYTLPDQGDPWLGRVLLLLCHFDIANPSISDDIIKLTCN